MNLHEYIKRGYRIEIFSRWHEEPGCVPTPRYGIKVGTIIIKEFLTEKQAQNYIIKNWKPK